MDEGVPYNDSGSGGSAVHTAKTIRFGEGAGYSGAWLEPAVELAKRGRLDYLSFECLAERTIALAQLARLRDPAGGYDPYLERRLRAVLVPCRRVGTRIITSAGAANPRGAGEKVVAIARELGLRGLRVGVVTGDDVSGSLDLDQATVLETGRPLRELAGRVVSANAYVGAEPLVEALNAGADVVVAGRVADPSLALGALRHAFGWGPQDWDLLGAGILVGHLTECGPQVTGGYFADPGVKDVADIANLGYPIAECNADGSAVITKLPQTGGTVSPATCAEQLLYEVHDPSAYVTPDVVADFSHVQLTAEGPDRVRVSGATGKPATPTLKVAVGYRDGFIGEGQISYGGEGCLARARLAGEVVVARLSAMGVRWRELRADLIGYDSLYGGAQAGNRPEPSEVRLRLVARTDTLEEAEAVGRELEGLWIAGPYGGGGATRGTREVIAVASMLLPRAAVRTEVTVLEA